MIGDRPAAEGKCFDHAAQIGTVVRWRLALIPGIFDTNAPCLLT